MLNRALGKGEVESSILSRSTTSPMQTRLPRMTKAGTREATCAGLGVVAHGRVARSWHKACRLCSARSDLLDQRRAALTLWAAHVTGEP